jgi:hypothetical protein
MNKLSDSSRATIVLLIIAVFVVIVAGLSIRTNNAVLATIVGVVVGATFAIIGNIVNVTWLGPLERKQDREEQREERKLELSDKNKNLRRALYGEILSLASNIGAYISYHKNMCATSGPGYIKPASDKALVDLSFRVYESLKTDPVAFYQLEESSSIDFAYGRLNTVYILLQHFEITSLGAGEASAKCASLIGAYKTSLMAIDVIYNLYKPILQDLDDGRFVKKWDALKQVQESEFGSITQ